MPPQKRALFREHAIQYHMGNRHKEVLPRFVSPPVFTFLWVLVALCLISGWIASTIHLPILTPGVGMVLTKNPSGETPVVLFVAAAQRPALHSGESARLQIGTGGPVLSGNITKVDSLILSPQDARVQYGLDGPIALLVTQPSVALTVLLPAAALAAGYQGSVAYAQIQVGEKSLLSFSLS
ncbi:MAG TPA: hypothetical protein VFN35_31905 [Ktedonobacteraceae bacterium]|nr:hypothetical protein [Ktedonobacteraceae bacterium]